MAEVKTHRVYEKVGMNECYDRTGKAPIGTRWVDVNKRGLCVPGVSLEAGSPGNKHETP